MGYKYTGKPLSKKEADDFLKRIQLKPRAVYDIDKLGKFKKRK